MGDFAVELQRAGVTGADDLGRFVRNVEFFGASAFDEKVAIPVLLDALPRLWDAQLVGAMAGHLRRRGARPYVRRPPRCLPHRWATVDSTTAWHLGEALGSAATLRRVGDLIAVCQEPQFGTARQMPLSALARFKIGRRTSSPTRPRPQRHPRHAYRRAEEVLTPGRSFGGPVGHGGHLDDVARVRPSAACRRAVVAHMPM